MNRIEHLLTIVGEECAEIAQRSSKALRFGLKEVQTGQKLDNAERIMQEMNDLVGVVEMLQAQGVLGALNREMIEFKKKKVEAYLEYSETQGTLA